MDAKTYYCDYARFGLWDADDNVLYADSVPSLYYNSICAPTWEFSIQADPGYGCYDVVKSANIVLEGPTSSVTSTKKENVPPYMVFGDSDDAGFKYDPYYPGYYEGNIIGRDMVAGDYYITAYFYSKGNLKGDLVATISTSFTVYADCCYGYYYDSSKAPGGRRLLLGGDLNGDV